jgi:hypothetical protein
MNPVSRCATNKKAAKAHMGFPERCTREGACGDDGSKFGKTYSDAWAIDMV